MIEYRGTKPLYIASGCIRIAKMPLFERLVRIYEGLSEILTEYCPTMVAIEKIFVHKNVSSALKLGHARGVAVVVAAKALLPIFEYTPRQIKKSVVGYGAAEKAQVQEMMRLLLGLSGIPQQDAADALAVAMCHGQTLKGISVLS